MRDKGLKPGELMGELYEDSQDCPQILLSHYPPLGKTSYITCLPPGQRVELYS